MSKPDVVCIVESWLDGDVSDEEISISGYSIVRLDRNRHGGGILIYIRSSLSFHITLTGPSGLELVFVTIHLSNGKSLFLGTFYRQPSSSVFVFDILFDILCSFDVTCFSNFILLGDFNVDVMSCSPLCNHLDAILQSFSLSQVVTEPTHIKHNGDLSLIDLVLMSAPETLSGCSTVPPLANSDHLGISIDILCRPLRSIRKRRVIWRYGYANFTMACAMINNLDLKYVFGSNTIGTCWTLWKNAF